jgi:ribosomal protein L37AE/L43A
MKRYESRKLTPWEEDTDLTSTQKFLKQHYKLYYSDRHRKIGESGEAEMINSFVPLRCPFCGTERFKRSGHTSNGIQRYMCGCCGKTFLPTTGTIFDDHKISISEWTEFCSNIFRHVSITADSWSNKNTFQTSRYWLQKLFLTLEDSQKDVVLSGKVWLDETFYSVHTENLLRKEDGSKPRGLSQNQICIGVATDRRYSVLLVEGMGKPSQRKTFEAFREHIEKGSQLIHDKESAHRRLVNELSLNSTVYSSKLLKGLSDKENPMNPVNRVHYVLKNFLNAHSSFDRKELQNWLNLFAFISNPPDDLLEKVDLIINLGFQNPKTLRYRDFFRNNTRVEEENSNTLQ